MDCCCLGATLDLAITKEVWMVSPVNRQPQRMVKPKKPTQKTLKSPSEIKGNLPTKPANTSSPGSTSPVHAQRDAPEEDASPSPSLVAISWIENMKFDNLETTLTGVKNTVTSKTSRIINLEEWHREFHGHLAELEKSYDDLRVQNKLRLHLCPTCYLNSWKLSISPGELKWTVPTTSARTRIMITRIHHNAVKEKIIQVAHNEGPLNYNGQ
ncbi:hypothetical protein D5F01_LYC15051 [Larimichthys crocea]|uniref:Uncharacterized protein n=1 Tax=Larimichthys crocea TaxID=215358 RepID=A0A6G0I6I2_LARCR|nr:hypothetical protein D5F01_LYC15051 [Larimichthys crocea]